ncbi:DNA cytosine methyltransferase [Herbaspirillum sp.]|uniref:DNA cytosine methyltransferase n=1 Tax=Herbaspirillum sp. TaxID=1890675 RepID=UPI0031DDB866
MVTRKSNNRNELISLSFFSGCLGLDLGLEQAGIHQVLACEIDKATRKSIAANKPNMPILDDLLAYTSEDIRKIAGLKKGQRPMLIVGGPPCQAFSTAGKRQGFTDPRGNVFLRYIQLIEDLQPEYAVIENVRGLLSAALKHRPLSERGSKFPPLSKEELPGSALAHILEWLNRIGYGVKFNLYNAANFGVPQTRERVILIAARNGGEVPYLQPTHSQDGSFGLPKWVSFKSAVTGLKEKDMVGVKFPEKRLKYYRHLGSGEYWRNLPENLQKEALGKSYYSGGGKTGFLRRLAWEKPSPTLVTHPAMPATDLAHPKLDRPLSVQEYKRLQMFPDDWIVEGTILDQYRQIGNAVPVGLGLAVGKAILEHMNGVARSREFVKFPYSRYRNTDDKSWETAFKAAVRKEEAKRRQAEQLELKEM